MQITNRHMKTLLVFVFFTLSLFCQAAERAKVTNDKYSAAWLERGAIAIIVLTKDIKNVSKEQTFNATEFQTWIRGYLGAIDIIGIAIDDEEEPNSKDLFNAPKKWWDTEVVAAEVLSFSREHAAIINSQLSSQKLMTAMYLTSHPKATWKQRLLAYLLLGYDKETATRKTNENYKKFNP